MSTIAERLEPRPATRLEIVEALRARSFGIVTFNNGLSGAVISLDSDDWNAILDAAIRELSKES